MRETLSRQLRLPSGHYAIGLPFNDQKEKLGESYKIALKRLQGLERRMVTDAKLYEDYRSFLKARSTMSR